jgi:predicted transcriptional regulator
VIAGSRRQFRAYRLRRNGKTYTEVAAEMGCTPTRARQLVVAAIKAQLGIKPMRGQHYRTQAEVKVLMRRGE